MWSLCSSSNSLLFWFTVLNNNVLRCGVGGGVTKVSTDHINSSCRQSGSQQTECKDLHWPMVGVSCGWGRVWRGGSELIGGSGSADRWWPPPSPSSPPRSPGSGRTPAGLQGQQRQTSQSGQVGRGSRALMMSLWCHVQISNRSLIKPGSQRHHLQRNSICGNM